MNTSEKPRNPPPSRWATRLMDGIVVLAIGSIAAIAVQRLTTSQSAAPRDMATVDLCPAVDEAYLSGTLYGALDRSIEWRGTDMTCEGGPRPNGDGVRLVFAAPDTNDGDRLVIVLGIDSAIDELVEAEHRVNVTVIDETSGRFFSSGNQERCWTTVAAVDHEGNLFRARGEIYCTGSLPSVSDASSISLSDFRFSGRFILDDS